MLSHNYIEVVTKSEWLGSGKGNKNGHNIMELSVPLS